MRRADFLLLTELETDEFKARSRRRQLPFVPDSAEGTWADYSVWDAFLTLLTTQLVAQGATLGDAAEFLFTYNHRIQYPHAILELQGTEYFVGYALYDDSNLRSKFPASRSMHKVALFGSFDQIQPTLDKFCVKLDAVHGLTLANASMVWRNLKERAQRHQIKIYRDGTTGTVWE